jgi:hypothetical protein
MARLNGRYSYLKGRWTPGFIDLTAEQHMLTVRDGSRASITLPLPGRARPEPAGPPFHRQAR